LERLVARLKSDYLGRRHMSPIAIYFVQAMVTVLAVVALAVIVLYGGRRLGLGRASGPLELLGRLPLEARRAVYLVRVGKVVYVVGASEGGLTRLGELDADAVPVAGPTHPSPTFAEVLGRIVRPPPPGSTPPSGPVP
jgi:flagellar protein FliO/FliZ